MITGKKAVKRKQEKKDESSGDSDDEEEEKTKPPQSKKSKKGLSFFKYSVSVICWQKKHLEQRTVIVIARRKIRNLKMIKLQAKQ